ncbi:MAG: ChaN family lipoprotein [Nitrospirae bacterium]|nr:ChaN family lipoprotein [Nitrospirota bacterium]
MRKSSLSPFCCAALLLIAAGCAAVSPPAEPAAQPFSGSPYADLDALKSGTIIHLPTGRELTQAELIDLAGRARVIYVGEMHTNMEHHRVQLAVIEALAKRWPGKIAVGMEMFQRPSQPQLDQWSRGELAAKPFKQLWYDNWGEEYGYYQAILELVRDQNIPLIALNASDEQVQKVRKQGLTGLSDDERAWLGPIDEKDPYQRRAMQAIFGGHSHGGNSGFERFYQSMLLWDETMARSAAEFLGSAAGKDKKLIILAGGFHVAYGYGIPKRLFRRLPEPYLIVLPYTPDALIPEEYRMPVQAPELPLYLADVIWSTGYSEPEFKRVRLGVRLDPKNHEAAVVTAVEPGSPAEKAGITSGDRITSLNGEKIDSLFELVERLRLIEPGDRAAVVLDRSGQKVELTVQF